MSCMKEEKSEWCQCQLDVLSTYFHKLVICSRGREFALGKREWRELTRWIIAHLWL